VWVDASLLAVQDDGGEEEVEHCKAEGLVILKREH
jgi:hypothetical protein